LADGQKILSVTELNKFIKMLIDKNPMLANISVSGEISNFKLHSTGHMYMSLKDSGSVIRAVMFKSAASKVVFRPENGMKVIATGRVSVFERDGQYQLYIDKLTPEGEGSLYIAFEQLKAKLNAEGLFAPERKRRIKRMPKRIGVVTSPTGAALRDMINILKRRFPLCEILIYPSLVQGPGAPAELIRGIEYLNKHKLCDTIIIGRGGGSIEELWAFNDEGVARAVAASSIPVISAVGHETDFTICDFVADLRAPTPSAAAELCTPDFADIYAFLEKSDRAMSASLTKKISYNRSLYERLSKSGVLANPQRMLSEKIMTVEHLDMKMSSALSLALTRKKHEYDANLNKLHALSPLNVLSRGYSVAMSEDGRVIRSESDISCGDEIKIYSHSVTMGAKVTEIIPASDTEDNKNG